MLIKDLTPNGLNTIFKVKEVLLNISKYDLIIYRQYTYTMYIVFILQSQQNQNNCQIVLKEHIQASF